MSRADWTFPVENVVTGNDVGPALQVISQDVKTVGFHQAEHTVAGDLRVSEALSRPVQGI